MTDAEKQKLWKEIQERDPTLAEFLRLVKKHFGKGEVKFIPVKR